MFTYLASPYTARRFEAAMDAVCWLLDSGVTVYSPVLHFHPIATTHNLPKDIQFWRDHNLEMLLEAVNLCVLCIDGWDKSSGVAWEIQHARENGKPIRTMTPKVEARSKGYRIEEFS